MKTVIVTGASGNMGQAVVKKFLSEGYRVIGTIVPNDPVPITIPSGNFEKVTVDLMDEEDANRFITTVISKYDSIHAAVLTVGGFARGNIAETKTSQIYKQYQLNFETAYNVARPVFTHMMNMQKGRIFLIGSRPGMNAKDSKGMIAYAMAKSLIFRLAECLNIESDGVNVVTSVIVPSTIDTPANRNSMPKADFDTWVRPEAIAEIIYFYCTDEADVIREPVIKIFKNA